VPRSGEEGAAQDAIVRIARALLLGELSAIEAARQIQDLTWDSERLQWDDDVVTFRGIASATDVHLVGDPESGWHSDVKEQRLAERAVDEEFYRPRALAAARNLVTKFGSDGR
jgi:hypothetical protein